jgi:hypothetical protein
MVFGSRRVPAVSLVSRAHGMPVASPGAVSAVVDVSARGPSMTRSGALAGALAPGRLRIGGSRRRDYDTAESERGDRCEHEARARAQLGATADRRLLALCFGHGRGIGHAGAER